MNITSFLSIGLARKVDRVLKIICRSIHYFLFVAFFTIMATMVYSGLKLLYFLEDNKVKIIITFFGVWIVFNILFNYLMACCVGPGHPNSLPAYLLERIDHRCKRCDSIKPPRTHHCSMCNECVMQMDHHCPWIGTCVGHENRRYFLNFLTYTLFGVGLYMIIIWFTNHASNYMENIAFSVSIFITLFCFSVFHWILALSGRTTLQCCFGDPRYTPSNNICHNFFIIYGTYNIIKAFCPNVKPLQTEGLDWGGDYIPTNSFPPMQRFVDVDIST